MRRLALLLVLAAPAGADCPPAADLSAADPIYDDLALAPNAAAARDGSGRLWALWLQAPDERAQALLDRGMRQREAFDLLGSRATLGMLTDYCPDYAEGWNQRAFAAFLAGLHEAALEDLDRALALDPRHLGALTGRALTLVELERFEEAQADVRRALDLNPWLAERGILSLDPETGLFDPDRDPGRPGERPSGIEL
ncbi:tetratricopeptide repeat protein [Jannaschia sp. Os4]|uniref:tetratricopeptide repeat protein n=1 Tax=Jannaschia sp. Os4 TaxID=2807617 RepID=UPI00193A7A9D|nr:tetratricopeptide repeat protein [Jannaschia sp. Os4]MBM2577909.1 tetratricopeptide repeat protein [Jannaschia sp. Os4]